MDMSVLQFAEVLQCGIQALNSYRTWDIEDRPNVDFADQYGIYDSDRTLQGTVQAGLKRKRVFSNRTKTECMTCRKRKKKYDEEHLYF